MSITDALTAARARLAALEVNPLWGHEKQTAEIRKDALAIFDELIAQAEAATQCPYLETVGGDKWCRFPDEPKPDYITGENDG